MAARRTEKQNMMRAYEVEQEEKRIQEEFERRQEEEAREAAEEYKLYKEEQEAKKRKQRQKDLITDAYNWDYETCWPID